MQTRHRAENKKTERGERNGFPKKIPMLERDTLVSDALFITSLATASMLLKPKDAKSQEKAEISVLPKEVITKPAGSSSSTSILLGIALVIVALGTGFKYGLLNQYESFRKQS